LFDAGLKPKMSAAAVTEQGLVPAREVTGTTLVTPIKFEGKQGDEYWLGLHNFYVITRYNHSAMYAMAVHQLSGALRARML
jgi:membrane-bound lytic murein transglycosylase B